MHLPEDLVVQILSRASPTCLARMRCVSKRWKTLIKGGRLAEKHSEVVMMLTDNRVYQVSIDFDEIQNHKAKVPRQFSLKDPLSSNSSKQVDIVNVFHCDGFLLCTTKDNRLVVWNPCTRETRWIQPRDTYKEFDYFALGKSSSNNYKILRVEQYDCLPPILVEFEIYDFISSTWRVVGKTRDWYIPRWKARGMSVKGSTYWLACSQDDIKGKLLLRFDYSTESFGKVSLPGNPLSYDDISLSVTREDQKLCLLATQRRKFRDIDVWIATKIERFNRNREKRRKAEIERYEAASWSKFISVCLADLPQPPFYFFNGTNFLVDRENHVLVCCKAGEFSKTLLHLVKERNCIKVYHHDAKSTSSLVFGYVPSFEQIRQG